MRRRSTAQGAPVSARLSVAPRDERCAELVRARPVDALQGADKVVRHPPPRCHGVSVARVAVEVVLEQQHLRRGVLSRSSAIATCGRRHGEHRRGRLALARGGDCRRAGLESSRDAGSGYGSYGGVADPKCNRPPAELPYDRKASTRLAAARRRRGGIGLPLPLEQHSRGIASRLLRGGRKAVARMPHSPRRHPLSR